ncbi:MAG: hypothetical protein ACI8RZ_005743 [Myxococcota bacterium]|jgi:hypothetical protein
MPGTGVERAPTEAVMLAALLIMAGCKDKAVDETSSTVLLEAQAECLTDRVGENLR